MYNRRLVEPVGGGPRIHTSPTSKCPLFTQFLFILVLIFNVE